MADALFDTTVFIDYHRGDPEARRLFQHVFDGEWSASYSPITVFELWVGRMDRREEMEYASFLQLMEEIPLDTAIAQRAAHFLRGRSEPERQRHIGDAFIAATASKSGLPVYSRNADDLRLFHSDVRAY